MKINRKALKIATGSALMLAVGSAYAFHDGGVAKCDGCHTMHNSVNGVAFSANAAKDGRLLKGTDPSSTCLLCHGNPAKGYRAMSATANTFSPGGDFFWVKSTSNWGTHVPQQSGHNIVAADFGLVADTVNVMAPGGAYPNTDLSCVSCHDPHGQQAGGTPAGQDAIEASGSYANTLEHGGQLGNYRLLGDNGYRAINADAPIAVTAGFTETDASHPAYGSGMSEWCGSCHGAFLDSSSGTHRHPAGNNAAAALTAEIITNYNSYIRSGDWELAANRYDPLVPFEYGTAISRDDLILNITSNAGPATGAQVMCLSCHRSHASAWDNMTRWDTGVTFLVEQLRPTAAELTAISAVANAPYYGRPIGDATEYGYLQRSLCNKCHGKD